MTETHFILTKTCHPDGIVQGILIAFQGLLHFRSGLEIKLIRGEPESLLIVYRFPGLNTEKDIMGLCVLLIQVMAIVCTDEGDGEIVGDLSERTVYPFLIREFIGLDLEIKPVMIKNRRHLLCLFPGRLNLSGVNKIRNRPFKAARKGNKAGVMFPEKIHIHAGTVIEPF